MLSIHRSHSILPHMRHSTRKVALSGERREQDELIEAIEKDRSGQENWQLTNEPDVEGLDEFWTGVEKDLKNDPTWFNFAED